MEDDYTKMYKLLEQYIKYFDNIIILHKKIENKMKGLLFDKEVVLDGYLYTSFKNSSILEIKARIPHNDTTIDVPFIKIQPVPDESTDPERTKLDKFRSYQFPISTNKAFNMSKLEDGENNGTIAINDNQVQKVLTCLEEFTPEVHFQLRTIYDDTLLFMYVLSLCISDLKILFNLCVKTDYYNFLDYDKAVQFNLEIEEMINGI